MSENIKIIRVFIASPGDVKPERDIAYSVMDEVNEIFSNLRSTFNATIEAVGWEKLAPIQGIPNKSISKRIPVEECDVVIGIFWKKFGNPPGTLRHDGTEYSSGTEEEIEKAFEMARKNDKAAIMLYRKIDNPEIKTVDEIRQYEKVTSFFNECDAKGKHPAIYFEFSASDFRVLLRNHLLQVVSDIAKTYKVVSLPVVAPEIIEKNITEPSSNVIYYSKDISLTKQPLNEVKLIFVGQGSAGKTALRERLLHNKFNEKPVRTEGVNVDEAFIVSDKGSGRRIKLNIWDFGGQEIMHATHQFFLTKRSLYLLVLDARLTQEENRVEYWLKIIQSFGGESPVLIVGNKIDQHPLDIDRTGLQKKYPNIAGILETSAATGTGIEEFKAAIAEQVNNLPHVGDLLPETWFRVKNKLESFGRQSNFITHDRYLELCAENGVTDETSQHTLIGFLHDLGVILNFQDDPRLDSLGILNPQWVTNGVYKILNSHALFKNRGILTVPMLDEILNLSEYPRDKRLFIVDMMKKFELCYDIEPDKTFLVPDLLPKDEPAELEFTGVPAFEYAYPVLPTSSAT